MSEPQSSETDVEASLQALLDGLQRSDTYQAFVDAETRLQENPESLALLEEYQAKHGQLQENEFDQSIMSELQELQTAIADDDVIQQYQTAEQELVDLLNQTNDVISEQIGSEFAQSLGGGCC